MPYVSPKDIARVRTNAAVADLASSLECARIDEQPTQTAEPADPPSSGSDEPKEDPPSSHEATEAPETITTAAPETTPAADSVAEPSPLESSRSHTSDVPSLLSCGTDSSNSLHTLSSIETDAEFDMAVEIAEHDDDVEIAYDDDDDDVVLTTPEMAQYHRDMIAFTKPLYDRAKMIVDRKLRVQRARGVVR